MASEFFLSDGIREIDLRDVLTPGLADISDSIDAICTSQNQISKLYRKPYLYMTCTLTGASRGRCFI